MNIRLFAFAAALLITAPAFSQVTKKPATKSTDKKEEAAPATSSDNLVVNGSFENCDTKTLKVYGQLKDLCMPWFTPNKTSPDLFAQGVKGTKVVAGQNDYGKQDPADGTCYAGIRALTKDPKKIRTYLETKLTTRMVKDQLYCIKMQVSLAELSKFATNNIGIFLSDRKIQNGTDFALSFTPQITKKNNPVIKTMDGWELICGTYIAKGNEEYIVIGGFGEENAMIIEKTKKPAGVTGTVNNDAYYYVDNIEIIAVDAPSQCVCGKAEVIEPELIYSRATAKDINMTPQQYVELSGVYFANLNSEIPAQFEPELDELVEVLKKNPGISIVLTGHSTTEEIQEASVNSRLAEIAKRRAEKVKEYLVKGGIDAARIDVASKDDTDPANTRPTPLSKAQNRRVVFTVK